MEQALPLVSPVLRRAVAKWRKVDGATWVEVTFGLGSLLCGVAEGVDEHAVVPDSTVSPDWHSLARFRPISAVRRSAASALPHFDGATDDAQSCFDTVVATDRAAAHRVAALRREGRSAAQSAEKHLDLAYTEFKYWRVSPIGSLLKREASTALRKATRQQHASRLTSMAQQGRAATGALSALMGELAGAYPEEPE